jgi:hypothetical protein
MSIRRVSSIVVVVVVLVALRNAGGTFTFVADLSDSDVMIERRFETHQNEAEPKVIFRGSFTKLLLVEYPEILSRKLFLRFNIATS